MSPDVLCNIIQAAPRVFRLIAEFDSQPAAYVHPSRLAGLVPGRLLDAISASRRGRRELSHWLCRHYGLVPVVFAEFSQPRRRLALLEPGVLRRLLTYAGAAIASPEIARAVDRATVSSLKKSLGEEVYCFAVKRAPFLLGEAIAAPLASPPDASDWTSRIRLGGCRCLAQCLAGDSAAIHSRVTLKLDAQWPLDFSVGATDEQRQLAWTVLRRILLHEIDPGWSPCFN